MASSASGDYRNRIVGHGQEEPERMLPNPHNWRRHPDFQKAVVSATLSEVGWVQEIIYNVRTKRLVDGHLRVALAMERMERTVPVTYVDLEPDEEALILAALDTSTGLAETDQEALDRLLGEVETEDERLLELFAQLTSQQIEPDTEPRLEPEVVISPELLERHDYIVFVFDNRPDYEAARDAFGLGQVHDRSPDERGVTRETNEGAGHVVPGRQLIERLAQGLGDD